MQRTGGPDLAATPLPGPPGRSQGGLPLDLARRRIISLLVAGATDPALRVEVLRALDGTSVVLPANFQRDADRGAVALLADLRGFADIPLHVTLVKHVESELAALEAAESSLQAVLRDQLTLLSTASPPIVPPPPSLANYTSSMALSTATLAAAVSKHDLLTLTATLAHVLPPSSPAMLQRISEIHAQDISEMQASVAQLEEQLEEYEVQIRQPAEGSNRSKKSFRQILGDYDKLRVEMREIRGDMKRFGC